MPDVTKDVRDFMQRAALELAIEDLDESFGQIPDRIEEASAKAAEEAKKFWSEEAGRRLNTTRNRYQAALYIDEEFGEDGGLVITMHDTDKLVIAIEEGSPGFDLKPGFLKGGSRRVIPIPSPPKDMRVVTDTQGTDKWMHPGWDGLELAQETDKHIDEVIVPRHLNEIFENL